MKLYGLRSALLATAACAVIAQPAPPGVPSEFIPRDVPQVHYSRGIEYLSGGARRDERRQMLAQSARYPLRMVFNAATGAHAVVDEITLSAEGGAVVFDARQAGPLLMLSLPPGRYLARAGFHGVVQQRQITVGPGAQTVQWIASAPE